MTAGNDARLDDLTRRYPGWRMWRGRATGEVWALPPAGVPQYGLVGAADADALEVRIAEITSWAASSHNPRRNAGARQAAGLLRDSEPPVLTASPHYLP
jgi:hypothetical protein